MALPHRRFLHEGRRHRRRGAALHDGSRHSISGIYGCIVYNTVLALLLEAGHGLCFSCRLCERRCPMSLPVSEMVARGDMEADECLLCGECADACPRLAISLSWKRPVSRGGKPKGAGA